MTKIRFDLDKSTEREIREQINEFLEEVAIHLSNELKKEVPVDRGQLRQGIQVLSDGDDYAVVVQPEHSVYVQTGAEPFTPPVEPLKNWARRNLGNEDLGWAIQQKISQEGIEPNPYVDRAIDNLQQRFS